MPEKKNWTRLCNVSHNGWIHPFKSGMEKCMSPQNIFSFCPQLLLQNWTELFWGFWVPFRMLLSTFAFYPSFISEFHSEIIRAREMQQNCRLLGWTTPAITPLTLDTHLPQAISPHWCNGCVPEQAFFFCARVSSRQAAVVLLTAAHRQLPEAMDHSSLGAAFQAKCSVSAGVLIHSVTYDYKHRLIDTKFSAPGKVKR